MVALECSTPQDALTQITDTLESYNIIWSPKLQGTSSITYNVKPYNVVYDWDVAVPKFIILQGVQIVNTELTLITYEGVTFEDLSNYKCGDYCTLFSADLRGFASAHIVEFTKVTDTLVRFTLNDNYNPEIYDFYLAFYAVK